MEKVLILKYYYKKRYAFWGYNLIFVSAQNYWWLWINVYPTFSLLVWCFQVSLDLCKIRLPSTSPCQVYVMSLGKGGQRIFPCKGFPFSLMGPNHYFHCLSFTWTRFFPKVNENLHARAVLCWTSQDNAGMPYRVTLFLVT